MCSSNSMETLIVTEPSALNVYQRGVDDIEDLHQKQTEFITKDTTSLLNQRGSLRLQGILSVIGGVLISISLGSCFTFGNMLPYFASYMASKGEGDYTHFVSLCNYIIAFTVAGEAIMGPVGGWLGAQIGYKYAILIGGGIQSIFGVVMTYFVCSQPMLSWLTYGVLFGVGMGIAYPNILVVVMEWFPEHKGLVSGVVLSGYGLSAIIMDKLQTALINPENVEQDESTGFTDSALLSRFPSVFLYLGALYFGMQCIGVLLISNAPKSTVKLNVDGEDEEEKEPLIGRVVVSTEVMEGENDGDDDSNSVMMVVRDRRFWSLYFNFFFDGLVITFIATQWKLNSNKLGITDDAYLSTMGSVSAVFNGVGRPLFGAILDKTGSFRFTLGGVNLLLTVLLLSWPYCSGRAMAMIWLCGLFGGFSANFSIFATVTTNLFGVDHPNNIGIIVGFIFSSQIFSAFIGIYGLEALNDVFSDWKSMSFVVAAVQFVGAVVALTFNIGPCYKAYDGLSLKRY